MSALTSLTSQRVLDDTMTLVQDHIPLKATGYRCQTTDLWRVLLSAMTRTHSLSATCTALAGAPHPNTIRGYLARQWTPAAIPELEAQSNAALRATIPAWVTSTAVEVAIDTHDCPFYGQIPDGDDTWVCRGKMRAGTNAHYRCATLAVLARHTRITVAVTFVQPGETMAALVERLLVQTQAAGITIKCLYGDKGFCSVGVFQTLQAAKIPAIIAVPMRRPGIGDHAHGAESHWVTHTFTSQTAGQATVRVAVVRTYAKRRSGRYELRWCLFACLHVRDSLIGVRRRYRKRFGIESIYRQLEGLRIRTTATNPALRLGSPANCVMLRCVALDFVRKLFLAQAAGRPGSHSLRESLRLMLIALGLLLINVWVWVHWTYLRIAGGGPRRVDQTVLRLHGFLGFLQDAVLQWYGSAPTIPLAGYCPYLVTTGNL